MLLKFHLVVLVVIAVSVNTYSQVFESIEKAAAQYFINLSNKNLDADNDLIDIKTYKKLKLWIKVVCQNHL